MKINLVGFMSPARRRVASSRRAWALFAEELVDYLLSNRPASAVPLDCLYARSTSAVAHPAGQTFDAADGLAPIRYHSYSIVNLRK